MSVVLAGQTAADVFRQTPSIHPLTLSQTPEAH
jgi:hypothetical protein